MRELSLPRFLSGVVALLALVFAGAGAAGERVYLSPEDFIASQLPQSPQEKRLWVTPQLQAKASSILNHAPNPLRPRYWTDGKRTVWILQEIGKEDYITAGFAVERGTIAAARVLIYRESRGGEVRYPAFLRQFDGASLTDGAYLNKTIDGISGATLSVRAMEKMARLALLYDRAAKEQAD